MSEAFEWIYSHVTWIFYILIILFLGFVGITTFQLNNYNHTAGEVLARYGGLTPAAARNLYDEHKSRYGQMFYVTTEDGKFIDQPVGYGQPINYVLHLNIPFLESSIKTYNQIGLHESVPSDVRDSESRITAQSNDLDPRTGILEQIRQVAKDHPDSKDDDKSSSINGSAFVQNMVDTGDAKTSDQILIYGINDAKDVKKLLDRDDKMVANYDKEHNDRSTSLQDAVSKQDDKDKWLRENDSQKQDFPKPNKDLIGNDLSIGECKKIAKAIEEHASSISFIIYRPGNKDSKTSPYRDDSGHLNLVTVNLDPDSSIQ